jgi:hypothetical protein
MITRAILSLLKHNNRVNLPTLGAIIKQQDFSQSLFFNQFIKHDDGVLFNHLTKIEMLTEEESEAALHTFIEAIQDGIRRDGKFEIRELGVFCFVDNRLELLNEKEYARVLARLSASDVRRTLDPAHTTDHHDKTQSLGNCEHAGDNSIENFPNASDEHCANPDGLVLLSFEALPLNTHKESEPSKKWSQSAGTFSKIRGSSVALKFIRIIIPPVVLGLVLFRLSLPIPGGHQNINAPIDTTALNRPDSIFNHAQTFVETHSTLMPVSGTSDPEENRKDTESGLIYHVIIGAFRFESNADKLVSEQQTRGHVVSKLAKRNGFYLVSYESTTDVWMAKKICNDLKALYPEVWLEKHE